ncbi:hypothetical protein [Rhodococcus sp. ACPA4]|nr:hypothetical protein [Rhodococcus sp. ACPA4]
MITERPTTRFVDSPQAPTFSATTVQTIIYFVPKVGLTIGE